MMVYTTGAGVNGFTLDPAIGAFILSHPNIRFPRTWLSVSVNESNADSFPAYCRNYLHWV